MIAYHLDRKKTLVSNCILDLTPTNNNNSNDIYGLDNVSYFGLSRYNFLSMNEVFDYEFVNSCAIDFFVETVRYTSFPDKPSRFKSIFAVKKPEDFLLWNEYLPLNSDSVIWEIEYTHNSCFYCDARHLIGGIIFDPLQTMNAYHNYWSGIFTNNPLPELLIELPVTVKKQFDISKLI